MPQVVRVSSRNARERIEVRCDDSTSGAAILDAVGPVGPDDIVVLQVASDAGETACAGILEARTTLAGQCARVRVAILLAEDADGCALNIDPDNSIYAALALTEKLRAAGSDLAWWLRLEEPSLWGLDGLHSLARDTGVDLVPVASGAELAPDAQLFVWDFVKYALLGEFRGELGPARSAYLDALLEAAGGGRLADPGDGMAGLLTDALREPKAEAKEAGEIGLSDVVEVASMGLRGHAQAFLAPKTRMALPKSIASAVLVGAYGGEHIGDIAILGGVLRRMHEEFGLKEAVLMTQRPNHTRHLMKMMETPVALTVEEYQPANVRKHLVARDALVHAGGPLTDIPKQLVRHLDAAALAKRWKKPFLMEGVGPNDFSRKVSRVTAERLVRLADRITVRCSDDASRPLVAGLEIGVGHDPAFDYLETRGAELTRLLPGEMDQVEALLDGADGRPLIGLNIRPIYALFTKKAPDGDRAKYTREVEDRMERALAEGIARFAAECEQQPRFIFFPMNAVQFGKSDNRSAYRIVRHLPKGLDVRVWQNDASLDAVVALIRRLDAAITMRFHATIFALSQGCPPIGIDYRVGVKDKVAAVMEDYGQEEFCSRIDLIEADWLVEKLHARLAGGRGQKPNHKNT